MRFSKSLACATDLLSRRYARALTQVSESRRGRLETAGTGSKIGPMLTRFTRALILLAAAGAVYAGPVAACLCVAEPMEAMPCCPDDAQQQDHSNCAQPDSELNAACDPVPADILSAGTQDLSPPIAIFGALAPWSVHGPPVSAIATSPPPHNFPPIYLITLRLRI